MTISLTPPVSLKAIRNDFNKTGRSGSDERYVRDYNQFPDGEDWDLLAYQGQAYGLQYEFSSDNWGAINDSSNIPKDTSDKREAGDYTGLNSQTNIEFGDDATRGKYAKFSLTQSGWHTNPGAVGLNGFWYAEDTGPDNLYRVTATIETTSNFPINSEVWLDIFGYQYGYLDGSRSDYLLFGNGVRPGPNTTQYVDEVFTVNSFRRHIVMNFNLFSPSGPRSGSETAEMIVSNAKVKRI